MLFFTRLCRKLRDFSLLAAALLAVAIVSSCSAYDSENSTLAEYSKLLAFKKTQKNTSQDRSFSFNLFSDDGLVDFITGRTLLPNSTTEEEIVYYLAYKNLGDPGSGWIVDSNFKMTSIDSNTATISKTLAVSHYQMNLYGLTASRDADLKRSSTIVPETYQYYAAYIATSYVDLRYGDSISFHLRANAISTCTGNISVKIQHENNWFVPPVTQVTAGLYKPGTDELVYPKNSGPKVLHGKYSYASALTVTAFGEGEELPPGSFDIIVKYTSYSPSNYEKVVSEYQYSERIIIMANQKVSCNMKIPYFLNDAPKPPTCFIAGYKDPESASSGYFKVQFSWFDNSNVEDNFKLELVNITGSDPVSTPTDDESWRKWGSYFGNSSIYDHLTATTSIYVLDGTMEQNSTSLTMELPLGSRYIARICAVNSVGASPWEYLKLPQTRTYTNPADITQFSKIDDDFSCFDADVPALNRYRLTYALNLGKLATTDGSPVPELMYYESQHSDDITREVFSSTKVEILNPDGITSGLTLTNMKNTWKCWLRGDFTGSVYESTYSYVAAPATYIEGIRYYADEFGTLPALQPTSENYNPVGLFVRKVAIVPYTDYKNITFFASYYEDVAEMDLSPYYIEPEHIRLQFLYRGNTIKEIRDGVFVPDPDGDGAVNLSDMENDSVLTLSLSKVDGFIIMMDDSAYPYNSLKLSSFRGKDNLDIQTDVPDYHKLWSVSMTDKEVWTEGIYFVNLKGVTSAVPDRAFGYSLMIILTE